MNFDIIEISDEEVEKLTVVQLKLLRTAQQKKDALYHKLQNDLREYKMTFATSGRKMSSIYNTMEFDLLQEFYYQVEIIREQLEFNMSLREPTTGDETGGGGETGGDETGYVVDYQLSYLERYIAVRDYYLTIEDPNERLEIFNKDQVARKYLDSYYTHLFDYFYSFTIKH